MSIDNLPDAAQLQAKMYALQLVVAALLVRHFEQTGDSQAEAKEIADIALGSIRKFDLRGNATALQKDTARAVMEAFATETIHAAEYSVRMRGAQRSR